MRVPLMQEDRQPDVGGKRELRGKRRLLAIAWGKVAVVIEPTLANGDGARACEQSAQRHDTVLV